MNRKKFKVRKDQASVSTPHSTRVTLISAMFSKRNTCTCSFQLLAVNTKRKFMKKVPTGETAVNITACASTARLVTTNVKLCKNRMYSLLY